MAENTRLTGVCVGAGAVRSDSVFSVVAHSGNVLLKIVASRLSNNVNVFWIIPEKQYGLHPARSTVDMLFVVRRPQELGRATKMPLYM